MSSNFTGGNPARGANYHTRNAIYRVPASFYNAVLPHGAIAFLLCEGNMRGAVHDGKTCGGVAHWPLFHPSCDFTALGELIDCPEDLNNNGTSDSTEETEEPVNTLWLLLSKISPAGGEHPEFAGSVHVANLGAGAVHPAGAEMGNGITKWNAFAFCAPSQPALDSENHYWIAGSINDYTIADVTSVSADPVCTQPKNK